MAVIFWFISLYFDYKSIKRLLAFARSKRKKDREQHHLLWIAAALVAVPTILITMWYAIGATLLFMTAPSSSTLPVDAIANISGGYWRVSAPLFETLTLLLPFLTVIAIYLLVKRRRL